MNGIRPTVGIEFDDKYTNAKNKLLDFIKALDELDDIQKAKLAQEFITSYSMAISFEQFVSYMKNGGIKSCRLNMYRLYRSRWKDKLCSATLTEYSNTRVPTMFR